jgi:hypothetical protein
MSSGTATHHFHWSKLVPMVLCVALLTAQQTRAVRGSVKDQGGHVLAGAVVQIQNTTSHNIRSYITQKDGTYYFEELSPSVSYQLRATYRGIVGPVKTLSKFDSRTLATIDLTTHLDRGARSR